VGAAAVIVLALIVSGCSSKTANTTNTSKSLDKVTYLTAFGTFGREGYAYVALKKGFFKDAGIDVTIKPGAAGDSNLKNLLSGQAQFAAIDFSGALLQIGNNTPLSDFRAVAAIQQQTVISIMAAPGKGITQPKDLAGRNLSQATGSVIKKLFPLYAKLAGIDPKTVKWTETTPQALPALLAAGQTDGIGQFVVGAPAIKAALKGKDPVVLPYSQYLTDLYGAAIVSSNKEIASNPDLVKRFSGAILKGLQYTIDHPDESGDLIHSAVPTTDAKIATAELTLMAPYCKAGGMTTLGAFDPQRVARGIAVLQTGGLIPSGFDPAKAVDFDLAPKP
jgi:NitT/TauT family transport system substrate-binding protein